MADTNSDLIEELESVRVELARLNGHRFVRIHNSTMKLVTFQFLRGLAFGLGSVLGATILVSVAAYLLSQIDFLPIIGEWAAQIANQIDSADYGVSK